MSARPKNALTPAVACIRMSSDMQTDSPAQQREQVAKLAERLGFRIEKEFADEGISGVDTKRRKGFTAMLDYVKQPGTPKVILAWDQDRFSRLDSIDSGEIIAPLRRAGVKLHTIAQGEIDWNSFQGRMMFGISQEGKNQFLHDLSRNIVRGRTASAKRGQKFGNGNYAYDREILDEQGNVVRRVHFREFFAKPKSWSSRIVESADTESVKVLKWMFDCVANKGFTINELATQLYDRGILSPSGRPRWEWTTIARVLENQVYIGRCVNGTRRKGKFHSLAEPVIVDDAHPPLVSVEVFERAQVALKARRMSPRRPISAYTLSGLLRCAHCGAGMVGKRGSERYYNCTTSKYRRRTCPSPCVRADELERWILAQIADQALSADSLDRLHKELVKRLSDTTAAKRDVAAMKRKITKIKTDLETATANLARAKGDNFTAIADLMEQWRTDLRGCEAELSGASLIRGENPTSKAGRIIARLQDLRGDVLSCNPMTIRAALPQIVESIKIGHPAGATSRGSRRWQGTITFRGLMGRQVVEFTESDFAPLKSDGVAAVVRSIYKGQPITNQEYAAASGQRLTVIAAHYRLARAAERGFIRQVSRGLWEPVS